MKIHQYRENIFSFEYTNSDSNGSIQALGKTMSLSKQFSPKSKNLRHYIRLDGSIPCRSLIGWYTTNVEEITCPTCNEIMNAEGEIKKNE